MATTSRTIYSHYDPQDRTYLELETGQVPSTSKEIKVIDEAAEIWKTESSSAFKRRLPPAPRFVPATIQDGERNPDDDQHLQRSSSQPSSSADISSWYRSLNRNGTSAPPSTVPTPTPPAPRAPATTNDPWFIRNAVRLEQHPLSSCTSSLADILAREPPPKPTEPKFQPPVFLHIGPSNKGFGMLERSGWNEGEALGPDVARRTRVTEDEERLTARKRRHKTFLEETEVKEETIDVPVAGQTDDDITEIRKVALIDLTLSDSEDEDSDSENDEAGKIEGTISPTPVPASPSGRKALIIPLPTVLKSDRLGIGLKAKTVGPYKESRKRITHSAAAIAAHVRAAEDARRRKDKYGKGKKGLAREREQERLSRQRLLAYLNE